MDLVQNNTTIIAVVKIMGINRRKTQLACSVYFGTSSNSHAKKSRHVHGTYE